MMTHSDDEADLSDTPHTRFERYGLDTKDKNNRVRQGGPQKINKTKKWKNETPNNEHVGATPYSSVDIVAAMNTMLLREPVPTATNGVITYMTSKVRDYS